MEKSKQISPFLVKQQSPHCQGTMRLNEVIHRLFNFLNKKFRKSTLPVSAILYYFNIANLQSDKPQQLDFFLSGVI